MEWKHEIAIQISLWKKHVNIHDDIESSMGGSFTKYSTVVDDNKDVIIDIIDLVRDEEVVSEQGKRKETKT